MKKILLAVAIALLGILSYLVMFKGLNIGNLKINSIAQIKEQSEKLDVDLNNATEITAQTYPKTKSSLDTSITKLKTTKQQYENKIANLSDTDILKYQQTDKYEKEFLWTTIGTYATKQNLDLELSIVDTSSDDYYNLNFEVVGTYSEVADFIYLIENDDELGFRIENFSVVPYGITETTKYLNSTGGVISQNTDYPYEGSLQKQYSGTREKTTTQKQTSSSAASNTIVNTNTIGNSNTIENANTGDKQTTSTTTTTQNANSTTIMNSPDRVVASFIVKKVSVDLK